MNFISSEISFAVSFANSAEFSLLSFTALNMKVQSSNEFVLSDQSLIISSLSELALILDPTNARSMVLRMLLALFHCFSGELSDSFG